MAWHCMAWHGLAWHGMVCHGMVWYGMVWYGMVWYGMYVCIYVCTCVCIMHTHDIHMTHTHTHSICSACSRSTSTRCMRAFRQEGAKRSPRSIAFALMLPRLMDTLTIRAGSMWLVLPATVGLGGFCLIVRYWPFRRHTGCGSWLAVAFVPMLFGARPCIHGRASEGEGRLFDVTSPLGLAATLRGFSAGAARSVGACAGFWDSKRSANFHGGGLPGLRFGLGTLEFAVGVTDGDCVFVLWHSSGPCEAVAEQGPRFV